jgi:hypothetical protein
MHAILRSEGGRDRMLPADHRANREGPVPRACGYFDLPDLAAAMADVPHAASSPMLATVFDAM